MNMLNPITQHDAHYWQYLLTNGRRDEYLNLETQATWQRHTPAVQARLIKHGMAPVIDGKPAEPTTARQRRERLCAIGAHDYNTEQSWHSLRRVKDGPVQRVNHAGHHCKDCGKWEVRETS